MAVVRTLEALGARGLMLKWPNDIMAADRKAGGILCEARWSGDRPAWVVVGVGLNVRNELPAELYGTSSRLVDHGMTTDLQPLAQHVAQALLQAGDAAGPLSEAELGSLAERDWLLGRQLASPEEGRADGIQPEGALRVRRNDGSIVLVRAAPVDTAARVTLTE
jgi:BirA family biotin operon repressor/biotin-[acetyl-CoA-carboxylase] ligase